MAKRREIDWKSAEVHDGTLTVRLDGKASRKWADHLDAVLRRLGTRGDIEVKPSRITVAEVTRGAEPDVRHLLESAILQVNTDLAPDGDESPDEPEDEASAADREMTEAFRAFAD